MLPKRFDQARPFATLGAVLLAWILVPLAVKSFARVSFFELQAPFIAAAAYVRDLQEFWALRLHPKDELIKAGHEIAGVIAQYEFSQQELESLRAENVRLQNLLNLPPQPAFRYERARVARRDLSGWWQRLIIRKGANYGLVVGSPVVFAGGVVGRVSEVYGYTAVVDLITSPTFRLAASVEGDARPICYQGGLNDSFKAPRGTVEYVPTDIYASPTSPRLLLTSGLGGVFPTGLRIGRIVRLETSTDGLFQSGEVRVDERLVSLTEVTVLVPLETEDL
ncbi:MAG: rod shape-determining protein MreC [Opitutaceae bacterium]|nr:rod shape-determining protein MreC [Opitutaceae bacterium]